MKSKIGKPAWIGSLTTKALRLERLEGTIAINAASLGLNIMTSVIAARLLGPEGRGELAAIQNWALLAVAFGTLGVPTATAYFAGNDPKQATRIFATAQVFLMVVAIPAFTVMYILIPELLPSQSVNVIQNARVFLLLIPIQFGGFLPYFVLQGLGRLDIWNIIRVQFPILWLIVFVVAYLTEEFNASFIAQGYLVAMAFHCATWMLMMVVSVRGPYRPDLRLLPSLLRYGLPSMLTSVPRDLNLRIDQLVMAVFLPSSTLGLYVIAVAWSGLLAPVMNSLGQTLFPRMAALHDTQEQKDLLQRTLHISVLVGILLTGAILAITPFVIPLVYGLEFQEAVPAALILVIAGMVSHINSIIEEIFRGIGIPKWAMIAEVVGLVCTVVLLVLLLPLYGLMGAAVASLGSYVVVLIVLLIFTKLWTALPLRSIVVPGRSDVLILCEYIKRVTTTVGWQ